MKIKWYLIVVWVVAVSGVRGELAEETIREDGVSEVRLTVPYTEEARQLARRVAAQANEGYYRLPETGVRGFQAVYGVESGGKSVGKMTVDWSADKKEPAVSIQGKMGKKFREKLDGYGQSLIGPICGYLIRPESEAGFPLYAARLGEAYIVDISGGGKLPNVVSDLFIVSPDFLEVMEIGRLADGTSIKVIRSGVRSKTKNYVGSMTMTIRKPQGPDLHLRFVWHYARSEGVMFVKRFSASETEGEKKLSVTMNLEKVTFRRAGGTGDRGTDSRDRWREMGGEKPAMKKQVSEQANFVAYIPSDWKMVEGVQSSFRTLTVTDLSEKYRVTMFYGGSPVGGGLLPLTNHFVTGIRQAFPDLRIGNALISPDGARIVFDGRYTHRTTGGMEFRCWIAVGGGYFTLTSVEAPRGELTKMMPRFLTVLSNIQVTKGAFKGTPAEKVAMAPYRLRDNSASFLIPQGWRVQDFGTATFTAKDVSGLFSFSVANIEVITPAMQVQVPGVPVSDYLPPHRALKFLAERAGVASDISFVAVIPREDIAQAIRQVYTGPVTVEEFVATFTTQGRRCKSYSFGVSFGSRLNIDWRLWHITVAAPEDRFDAFVGNFVTMIQSYKIDDQFAMNYIAQGMARLRQLQRQTMEMVTRNAREIRQMMTAAYEERQRSWDYIDYQRTNYIRGQQDWISGMEGGTVYHTDSWGTKNTATGEYWEGQPYNYVNFTGENPKYNEQMTAITDRATYEKVFGVGP
jgi:hypothetical protein